MSGMGILHSRFDSALWAIHSYLDIIEAAERSRGGYRLSAKERGDLLSILAPAASAVHNRYIYSPHVDAAAIAEFLKRHRDDRGECRKAVTAAELKIRQSAEPLERADMPAIRYVLDALDAQRSYLSARIGGGC